MSTKPIGTRAGGMSTRRDISQLPRVVAWASALKSVQLVPTCTTRGRASERAEWTMRSPGRPPSVPVPATAPRWLLPYACLALIWGSSFLFMKVGLESLTPIGVAFARTGLGAATLLVACLVSRTASPPRATWPHLFVLAALFNSVPFALFAYGETHVSSIVAGLINAVTPLTTLVAILLAFPEEQPTRERMAGLGIGFTGVLVVLGPWRDLGGAEWLGMLACLAAVSCYGIAIPYARRYVLGRGYSPLALASGQVVLGALQLAPVAALGGVSSGPLLGRSVLAMLGLGCLGTGIAFLLNVGVLTVAGSTTASTVTYFTPLVAVLVGTTFLGEPLDWNEPVGAVVVVAGAALAQGFVGVPSRRAPEATTETDPTS